MARTRVLLFQRRVLSFQRPVQLRQLRGVGPQLLLHCEDPPGNVQPGDQFAGIDWLGQEIVGTGLQACQAVVTTIARRQQDDIGIAGVGPAPDPTAELQSIHRGHLPVGDQQPDPSLADPPPGLGPIGDGLDRVAQLLSARQSFREETRSSSAIKMSIISTNESG